MLATDGYSLKCFGNLLKLYTSKFIRNLLLIFYRNIFDYSFKKLFEIVNFKIKLLNWTEISHYLHIFTYLLLIPRISLQQLVIFRYFKSRLWCSDLMRLLNCLIVRTILTVKTYLTMTYTIN